MDRHDVAADELVTVGWGYGLAETAVAVSSLEAAGIHVLAHSRQTVPVLWQLTHALGGVALRVPRSQAAFAHRILAEIEPSEARRKSVARALLAIFVFLWFGVPPPPAGLFLVRGSSLATLRAESSGRAR